MENRLRWDGALRYPWHILCRTAGIYLSEQDRTAGMERCIMLAVVNAFLLKEDAVSRSRSKLAD